MDNNQAPFTVGQRVVCVAPTAWGKWTSSRFKEEYKGPKFKDVCVVRGYDIEGVLFEEYKDGYGFDCKHFAPIHELPADIREELCKQIYIGDTADAPVKEIVNN